MKITSSSYSYLYIWIFYFFSNKNKKNQKKKRQEKRHVLNINIVTIYNDLILTLYVETVWLGGTDVGTEGRWVWGSDISPFTYSAWNRAKGQPNNYNNQDCLSLYRPYNLTWCDEKCETRYQYICEKGIAQDS